MRKEQRMNRVRTLGALAISVMFPVCVYAAPAARIDSRSRRHGDGADRRQACARQRAEVSEGDMISTNAVAPSSVSPTAR